MLKRNILSEGIHQLSIYSPVTNYRNLAKNATDLLNDPQNIVELNQITIKRIIELSKHEPHVVLMAKFLEQVKINPFLLFTECQTCPMARKYNNIRFTLEDVLERTVSECDDICSVGGGGLLQDLIYLLKAASFVKKPRRLFIIENFRDYFECLGEDREINVFKFYENPQKLSENARERANWISVQSLKYLVFMEIFSRLGSPVEIILCETARNYFNYQKISRTNRRSVTMGIDLADDGFEFSLPEFYLASLSKNGLNFHVSMSGGQYIWDIFETVRPLKELPNEDLLEFVLTPAIPSQIKTISSSNFKRKPFYGLFYTIFYLNMKYISKWKVGFLFGGLAAVIYGLLKLS